MSESSSVPVSCNIPPPTILTKPLADLTSVSVLAAVKVNVSPTSYNVPTSSTSTPLTEPLLILLITSSASPFPILSISIFSSSEYRIPSFTIVAEETIDLTVNPTITSLSIEFAVILSPSVNVPVIDCI